MEFLQPTETASTSSEKQSLARRNARQGKKTQLSEKTRVEKDVIPTSEMKLLPDGKLLNTTSGHELKEPLTIADHGTLSTVTERKELPVEVTVSPPSSAIDDASDVLSDSPQKVAVETNNQKVWHSTERIRVIIPSRSIIHHLMVYGISLMMMQCHPTCQPV